MSGFSGNNTFSIEDNDSFDTVDGIGIFMLLLMFVILCFCCCFGKVVFCTDEDTSPIKRRDTEESVNFNI